MKIKDKVLLANIRAFAERNHNRRICYIPEAKAFTCQGDRYYVDPTPELMEIAKLGYFYIFELEEETRELEVTVVKNMDTGKEIMLPREKLDPDQFNRNCKEKFHQNCTAYATMVKVEEPSVESE